MTEWISQIEGTAAGHQAALWLALAAAFLHAVFGALQKGRHDPWLTRGAIDFSYCLMAAPFALFVVPWPEPHMWVIFAGAWAIHIVYKLLQAWAYTKGAYTVVYPVVRGTGPLFTVIGAYLIFGESFSGVQWLGVAVLVAGIFGLALYNFVYLVSERDTLNAALGLAVLTGLFVAVYLSGVVFHDRRAGHARDRRAPLAADGGSPRAWPVDDPWRGGGLCRLFQLWLDHAGDPSGQSGRGRRAA